MITGSRDTIEDSSRVNEALTLLESSGYDEQWRDLIAGEIFSGADIDVIIQDLLMNQVDVWTNYRQKDINRRINYHDA